MNEKIELRIPNVLGSEKLALEKAADVAREIGFSDDRIEDLKTALAEACINAMEHGNKFNKKTKVGIILVADKSSLHVTIQDEGAGIGQVKRPKITKENIPQRRGWGVFLIKNLVNEFNFVKNPKGGNEVRLIIHLDR